MKSNKKKKIYKKKNNKSYNKDIIGLIIIGLGIIFMISLFTLRVGLIGFLIRKTVFSMTGFGAYLIPIILISLGIVIILDKLDKKILKTISIIAILFIIFLVALDSKNISVNGFVNRIKTAIYLSKLSQGGGFIEIGRASCRERV